MASIFSSLHIPFMMTVGCGATGFIIVSNACFLLEGYLQVRARPTATTTRAIITIVQIVVGLRLLALASLRSDCLLFRLLLILRPNPQDMESHKRLRRFGIDIA